MKKWVKAAIAAALVCLLFLSTVYGFILYYAGYSVPQKSDVLIVLGCQLWGKSPSLILEYRLEKALALYKDGYGEHILVSGGQGGDEEESEAQAMKDWFVAHGIDRNKILMEEKSTSTYENLKFSRDIMEKNNLKTAVIVSSNFHIFRALMLADRLGIKASGCPAPMVIRSAPFYHCREIISVIKSFLLDR